jgi:hypothetical protein
MSQKCQYRKSRGLFNYFGSQREQRQRTSALGLIPDPSEMSLQVRKLPETDIVIAR